MITTMQIGIEYHEYDKYADYDELWWITWYWVKRVATERVYLVQRLKESNEYCLHFETKDSMKRLLCWVTQSSTNESLLTSKSIEQILWLIMLWIHKDLNSEHWELNDK